MLIPLAVQEGYITNYHFEIYTRVKIRLLSYPGNDIESTCHDICKYLESQFPELKHVRGWFYQKGIDHSWLEFRDSPVIIDAYPVAGVYATMVTTVGLLNPWSRLYIPKDREQDNLSEL